MLKQRVAGKWWHLHFILVRSVKVKAQSTALLRFIFNPHNNCKRAYVEKILEEEKRKKILTSLRGNECPTVQSQLCAKKNKSLPWPNQPRKLGIPGGPAHHVFIRSTSAFLSYLFLLLRGCWTRDMAKPSLLCFHTATRFQTAGIEPGEIPHLGFSHDAKL
jgi:hypothetical protein